MIKVYLNEKQLSIEKALTVRKLKSIHYPTADLVFLNGYAAEMSDKVSDGDRIIMINRKLTPKKTELESFITARHTPRVHDRLKTSSIAIIGIGGLGSNAAVSLARMGIGKLKLIDFDSVEPSNLNRQYYFLDQLGEKKTDALSKTIARTNPLVKLELYSHKVTEKNIIKQLTGYDVVIEAVDVADTKSMIFSNVLKYLPETYIIGASGIAGVYDTDLFQRKTIGKHGVIIGDFTNEAKKGRGLMATRVATAANIQANMAVRYILGAIADD